MRCPYCGGLETQVKDSRPTDDASSIRRRRVCPDCGGRFTTFERVQLREMMVVKKSGRRAPFDRDKLQRSVDVALRKRPATPERIERLMNGIVRQLESLGDGDISTEKIGELVMEGLKALDDVAYVRFASVYRNFREARDFSTLVGAARKRPGARAHARGRRKAASAAMSDGAEHRRKIYGRGAGVGAAGPGNDGAQSFGRRDPCEERRNRRRRLHRRPAGARTASASRSTRQASARAARRFT